MSYFEFCYFSLEDTRSTVKARSWTSHCFIKGSIKIKIEVINQYGSAVVILSALILRQESSFLCRFFSCLVVCFQTKKRTKRRFDESIFFIDNLIQSQILDREHKSLEFSKKKQMKILKRKKLKFPRFMLQISRQTIIFVIFERTKSSKRIIRAICNRRRKKNNGPRLFFSQTLIWQILYCHLLLLLLNFFH